MTRFSTVLVILAAACCRTSSSGGGHAETNVPPAVHDAAAAERPSKKVTMDAQPTVSAAEVDAHIERLADEHPTPGRRAAEDWLVAHVDAARPRLVAAATSGKPGLREMGAIRVLGRAGAAVDVPVLAKLAATDPDHRAAAWDAVKALAQHRSPEAGRALLALLDNHDPAVVGPALVAIGMRKDESMRKAVEAKLAHPNATVRYKAIGALMKLGVGPSRKLLEQRVKAEHDKDNLAQLHRALQHK